MGYPWNRFLQGMPPTLKVVDPCLPQQPLRLRFSQMCFQSLILEGTIMVVSFFFVFLSTVPVIAQMGLALRCSGSRIGWKPLVNVYSRIGFDTGNLSNRNPGGLPFTEAACIASEWLSMSTLSDCGLPRQPCASSSKPTTGLGKSLIPRNAAWQTWLATWDRTRLNHAQHCTTTVLVVLVTSTFLYFSDLSVS